MVLQLVHLSLYTPIHVNRVLTACVGDKISLTCSHDNDAVRGTQWIFSSVLKPLITILPFPLIHVVHSHSQISLNGHKELFCTSPLLLLRPVSLNGTMVECRDSGGGVFNQVGAITLCVIGKSTHFTGLLLILKVYSSVGMVLLVLELHTE